MNELPTCPVCHTRTKREALESQLVVWSGVEAIAEADSDKVQFIYENLTQYDGHTAISLLAAQLGELFEMIAQMGSLVDIPATLANYRRHVQESLLNCD